jgi:hypothetical protein
MSMQHDEKGFFSAGWDGEAIVRAIYNVQLLTLTDGFVAMGPEHGTGCS